MTICKGSAKVSKNDRIKSFGLLKLVKILALHPMRDTYKIKKALSQAIEPFYYLFMDYLASSTSSNSTSVTSSFPSSAPAS